MILTILLVIIGVLLMVLAVYLVPKWQTKKTKGIAANKKWEAENEFRKTLIQVFGGLVIITGLFFAYQELKNFQLAQENVKAGQIANRFSKAIELLKEDGTTKIGGIYALEQIAREAPENYLGTVIEVLSAVVRNAEVDEIKEDVKKPEEKKEVKIKMKPETQIAMTVLGRIRTKDNKKHWENLPRINLVNAKLMGANLMKANLMNADLFKVDLQRANLNGADLQGASFIVARLTNTSLSYADLTGASLSHADLTGASLSHADLTGASLRFADLTGAYLQRANLSGAILISADLREANLTGAKQLKVEQLLKAKTLFKVRGLPPEMEKELREKKPELFKNLF